MQSRRFAVPLLLIRPVLLNTYGVILRKSERLEEAVRSYEIVMKLQPNLQMSFTTAATPLTSWSAKKRL